MGVLITPKNKRLNDIIEFLNAKYSLNISQSLLDKSSFIDNSWFTGFTEAILRRTNFINKLLVLNTWKD
jgi:hypothetical protein